MPDETASQPPIKITALIGVLVAFALFAVIAGYSSRMTWDYADYDQDRAKVRYDTLAKLQQDEGKLINPVDAQGNSTAEWIDQAKGTIRIPIEEAMVREIDTLKAQPAAIGGAIAVTAPTAGATNAAPATPSAGATNAAPAASGAGPAPATTATAPPNPSNK